MRLLVVGPGALGLVFAARLAHAEHDVRLRGRAGTRPPGPHAAIRIEGTDPVTADVPWDTASPGAPDREAALVAVKSYDLESACRDLRGFPPRPILLIQNGLGIEAAAARGLDGTGDARPAVAGLVRAIVSIPSTWLGPGRARQAGRGEVVLPIDGPSGTSAADLWAGALGSAGLAVRRSASFDRELWRKLIVNASINPVTADHGIPNGRIAEDPWRGQALALLAEACAVAEAEGQRIAPDEAERDLFAVVRATAENRSSMLQDLDRGRPTEIDAISGELLRRGERAGLSLPNTRRAFERIRGRALAHRPPGRRAPSQA